jgi:hypothetical protein
MGVAVKVYEAGDDADRLKAVNSVEGARFSREAPVAQSITSAKTSIKQVPALFKDKNARFGDVNIDIGGGRFNLATEHLAERGTRNAEPKEKPAEGGVGDKPRQGHFVFPRRGEP